MPGSKPGALTNFATPHHRQIGKNGEPTGIRTPDTRLRRPLLYPTELPAHGILERKTGLEPATPSLEGWNSTIELHLHKNGAVDEARTRDLNLGKVALYQLSYYRILVRTKRLELLLR